MKTIDVTGKPCPIPVIEAKKALSAPETHEISVKVDNMIAVQNLQKMASGYGYLLSQNESGDGAFNVIIQKNKGGAEHGKPRPDCPGHEKKLVVVVGSDALGGGEAELGKILMKAFIYSLTELTVPPESIIFINRGAYLTACGSNTVEDIKKLEELGTEALTCGTCSGYYGLQDRLAVGSIIDMFGIVERMSLADNVINV